MRYPTLGIRHSPNVALLDQSVTDPYFSSVVLLALNENGADGGTTFDDASNSNHTLTAAGNFQWDTAQAPTGLTSSGLSDGTGDYLSAASHANFAFGTGDFTIDLWIRFAATSQANFSDWRATTGSEVRPVIYRANNQSIRFFVNGADRIVGTTNPTNGVWYHVEVGRSGTSTKFFINGTQEGSTYSDSNDYLQSACNIGAYAGAGGPLASLNGHIAAYRVTKGVCRNMSNFTPPTLPLPTS